LGDTHTQITRNQGIRLQDITYRRGALHGSLTVIIVTHRTGDMISLIDGRVIVANGKVSAWQPEKSTNDSAAA
jgi:hypothetical protein